MMIVIVLITEFCKILLRQLVHTICMLSVALSPWIRNFIGLHIDESSIGPHIVISNFC